MTPNIASVSVQYPHTGAQAQSNELGMRPMQERAFDKRGEQYLLIKSPPASGKSRALMFIALDKLKNQGLKQALVVVPEKSIGASFASEKLSEHGFWADWEVAPQWNLCNAPGGEGGKVAALGEFLASNDQVLVCTHATFRFAVERFGLAAFDQRLIAIDEFHHVSSNPDNKLGAQLGEFLARDQVHVVAMTGSYFRGDAEAVLSPEDEHKFKNVTYTYYEQLAGYEHLKTLEIGYFFYSGSYADSLSSVLRPNEKTILHIPNVNSRESTKDKIREVEHIYEVLGKWRGSDPVTGFQLIETSDGRVIKVADLVDPEHQSQVQASLRDPRIRTDPDYVDMIIALGMAKEGFDWVWCEHALTVGYRASLTEIVQIIGRATRDARGKAKARFTNLIAEPDASSKIVTEAINDTLKAIAASLLMEQVLAPKFEFRVKSPANQPTAGFDYGDSGYQAGGANVGFNPTTGQVQIELSGLSLPASVQAKQICSEDLNEIIASFVQDKETVERGLFDEDTIAEELTQMKMGKIIRDRYPELEALDQEAVRQHAIAAINLLQQGKIEAQQRYGSGEAQPNTALIEGIRKFAMDVRELNIDLIDSINPFKQAYSILAKSLNQDTLTQVAAAITAKRSSIDPAEAQELAIRAVAFKKQRGRLPQLTADDAWERRMAEGARAFVRYKDEGKYD